MTPRRAALAVVALVLLAGCSKPNKAAGYEDLATPPVQVVETSSPAPVPTPTEAAPTTATPSPRATTTKPKPAPTKTTDEPEPVDVYYENCAAVRAAGAAPIRAGEPGYSRKLDRDGDGVACES